MQSIVVQPKRHKITETGNKPASQTTSKTDRQQDRQADWQQDTDRPTNRHANSLCEALPADKDCAVPGEHWPARQAANHGMPPLAGWKQTTRLQPASLHVTHKQKFQFRLRCRKKQASSWIVEALYLDLEDLKQKFQQNWTNLQPPESSALPS